MRYKVLTDDFREGFAAGSELEEELTPAEELDAIEAGRIEVLPATYAVVGQNPVFDTPKGGTFTRALPAYQVRQLVEGGAIAPAEVELADTPAKELIANIAGEKDMAVLAELRAAEEARGDKARSTVLAALEERSVELANLTDAPTTEAGETADNAERG